MNDSINRKGAINAVCTVLYPDADKMNDAKKVLKEMPSVQPEPCEDAVSRNAIIQKLNMMDRYVSEKLRLCDTDKIFPKNEVFIVDDVYEEIIENLPSVHPERESIKWIPHKSIFGGLGKRVYTCNKCGHNIGFHVENFCPNCGGKYER